MLLKTLLPLLPLLPLPTRSYPYNPTVQRRFPHAQTHVESAGGVWVELLLHLPRGTHVLERTLA